MNKLRLLTATVFVAAACGGESGPIATGFDALEAEWIMVDVENPMIANGIRKALGRYDSVYSYVDSTVVVGVEVDMFGADGQPTGSLRADRGTIEGDSEEMVARGSVVLLTAEGNRRIETEELFYDPSDGRVWSEVETCIVEDGQVTRGSSFSSDESFVVIEIATFRTSPGTSCS